MLEDSSARPYIEKELSLSVEDRKGEKERKAEPERKSGPAEPAIPEPAIIAPEIATTVKQCSKELKIAQSKPRKVYKYKEEKLVPKIACLAYSILTGLIVFFCWEKFLSGF